jgi:hypothetical protein
MDVPAALAELEELSTQVTRAVVVEPGGSVAGAIGADDARAARLAQLGSDLLSTAGTIRAGGAEVTRVEVVLPAGGVFVVCEAGRTIVATTVPEPTSGLVLYDLRTTLRRLAEGAPG